MTRNYQRNLIGAALAGIVLLALSTPSNAQPPAPSKAAVLKKFIDATNDYKKGEYEKAKILFEVVTANKVSLSQSQQSDLKNWIQFNDLALQGRKRYGQLLELTAKAIWKNHLDDAIRQFKELDHNPYPTEEQRREFQILKTLNIVLGTFNGLLAACGNLS